MSDAAVDTGSEVATKETYRRESCGGGREALANETANAGNGEQEAGDEVVDEEEGGEEEGEEGGDGEEEDGDEDEAEAAADKQAAEDQ